MLRKLAAQMSNVNLLETAITGQTDFTFVRYSANSNSLSRHNLLDSKVTHSKSFVYEEIHAMSLHGSFLLLIFSLTVCLCVL
jgi:hypothetical protein